MVSREQRPCPGVPSDIPGRMHTRTRERIEMRINHPSSKLVRFHEVCYDKLATNGDGFPTTETPGRKYRFRPAHEELVDRKTPFIWLCLYGACPRCVQQSDHPCK